ncbi:hypothetical protein WH8501_25030 [Crocosphaera watsonii WH 8501]|uniref:hypothetical protein n=1 Tax=Crocosphaera watsonii TaxID=263511 RepID=UPI000039C61C|nr:hypothetical protein [Crocosphaera watsonii]
MGCPGAGFPHLTSEVPSPVVTPDGFPWTPVHVPLEVMVIADAIGAAASDNREKADVVTTDLKLIIRLLIEKSFNTIIVTQPCITSCITSCITKKSTNILLNYHRYFPIEPIWDLW